MTSHARQPKAAHSLQEKYKKCYHAGAIFCLSIVPVFVVLSLQIGFSGFAKRGAGWLRISFTTAVAVHLLCVFMSLFFLCSLYRSIDIEKEKGMKQRWWCRSAICHCSVYMFFASIMFLTSHPFLSKSVHFNKPHNLSSALDCMPWIFFAVMSLFLVLRSTVTHRRVVNRNTQELLEKTNNAQQTHYSGTEDKRTLLLIAITDMLCSVACSVISYVKLKGVPGRAVDRTALAAIVLLYACSVFVCFVWGCLHPPLPYLPSDNETSIASEPSLSDVR
jgi:hypothetical protein